VAVHVHHGLNQRADEWQYFCDSFCRQHTLLLKTEHIKLDTSSNLEEAARKARYRIFSSILQKNDAFLVAHHQNDQAETLLLQLFRGAGIDGLSAMSYENHLGEGVLLRPFLSKTREQLQLYARQYGLQWVTDSSNIDMRFSRNYLRQQIIPLIEKRWPSVVNNIARTAAHCQQAKKNLFDLAHQDTGLDLNDLTALPISSFNHLSQERKTNVLRCWLRSHVEKMPSVSTFNRIIEEVLSSKEDAMPLISWDTEQIRRYQDHLYVLNENDACPPQNKEWSQFPEILDLGEGHGVLQATPSKMGLVCPEKAHIEVRFRKGGEQLKWHGQTKSLKKLFQQWCVPPWQRSSVPLIYINNKLALVVGYAVSDSYFKDASRDGKAWFIEHRK